MDVAYRIEDLTRRTEYLNTTLEDKNQELITFLGSSMKFFSKRKRKMSSTTLVTVRTCSYIDFSD